MMEQPKNFKLEETTVWSFPERGSWATHNGSYRGNWSPYVPRNLMLRYSNKGDWILDQFVGSGTTLVEAKLLGRNAVGVDVNNEALKITDQKLCFKCEEESKVYIKQGDAKNMPFLKNESIDMICTHPPYADIIKYSQSISDDLSHLSYKDFLNSMTDVAKESYRVLKSDGICSFMMGDIRKKGNVLPLGMNSMQKFVDTGFTLKEIIIKEQHNCRSTSYWENQKRNFLLLAHEYIFVLSK